MIDVERLFINYIDMHSDAKKGFNYYAMDTRETPHDEIAETLIGYVLYKSDNSSSGYVEIWEAGENFGIVCSDERDVVNVYDFSLYIDYMSNDYIVTKSDLVKNYCDGILTGNIAKDITFDSWLEYLESESLIENLF